MSATAADDQKFLESVRTTLFVTGVLALIFGIMIAFHPVGSSAFVIAILAVYTAAVGVFNLYLAISGKGDLSAGTRWGYGLLGVLYLAAGVWLLIQDFKNTAVVAESAAITIGIVFGIVWLAEGIITLFAADKGPWLIIFAILSIIAGTSLLATPFFGGAMLWIFLGVWLIVIGAIQILRGIFFKHTVTVYNEAVAAEQQEQVSEVVDAVKKAAGKK